MAFSGISIAQTNDTFFALQRGFSGLSIVPPAVRVAAVTLSDGLGNVGTFAITNASIEAADAALPPVALTFPANVWTANETLFFFGVDPGVIRLNFDIAGTTLLGNPFSLSGVEVVPTLVELP